VTTRTAAVAALLAMALAGCGTTVQLAPNAEQSAAGGLTAPTAGAVPGNGSVPATNGGGSSAAGTTTGAGTVAPGGSTPGAQGGAAGPGLPSAGPAPSGARTGPLKIGILDAKSPTAAIAATGGKNPSGVDPAQLTRAFLHYYDRHGGMAGRKLEPIEYTIDPTSSSYQSDLSAACAKFTQDNHVGVVASQTGNTFSANYETCLTKAGVTNFEVGNGAPDNQSLQSYPRLYTTASPTVDRRVTAILRGLTQTGLLTSKTKIGVVVEDCPENTRAYTNTLEPLAKSLHLTLMRSDTDCVTGFNDAGSFFAQVGQAVLPFRSNGVSRVMFMTSFEIAALQAFDAQATAQGWSPDYALSSIAATAANASQYSAQSQARMFGVGWIPVLDTTGVPQSRAGDRCKAIARSEGMTVSSQADYAFLYQICDLFAVLEAALNAAHGYDDSTTLSNGLASAMRSFQSAYVLGATLRLGGSAHDGPTLFAPFGYVSKCSCFRYSNQPARLA